MKEYFGYLSQIISQKESISKTQTFLAYFLYLSPLMAQAAVCLLLIIAHFASSIELINYGNEVLHGDDNGRLYAYMLISLIAIGIILIIAGIFCARKKTLADATAILHSINVIYIMSYFFPYMVLALIHDPVETVLVYFIIILIIIVLLFLIYFSLPQSLVDIVDIDDVNKSLKIIPTKFLTFYFSLIHLCCGITLIIVIILLVNVAGGIRGIQLTQTLLLSIVVVIGNFLIGAPTYKQLSKYSKLTVRFESRDQNNSLKNNGGEVNMTSIGNEDNDNA